MTTDDIRKNALIRIVDDDAEVREAIEFMLICKGWRTAAYESAAAFLKDYSSVPPGCVLLDIRMPGMSGIELQAEMKAQKLTLPIIFVTGHGDVPTAVRALKLGAFNFLQKPIEAAPLMEAIESAVRLSLAQAQGRLSPEDARRAVDEMSPRERDITALLRAGLSNREIAEHFGLSEQTIQGHRNNIFRKLRVHNYRELLETIGGLEGFEGFESKKASSP